MQAHTRELEDGPLSNQISHFSGTEIHLPQPISVYHHPVLGVGLTRRRFLTAHFLVASRQKD